ncbi:hypothetical protein K435DRAFT_559295, partial [Dendrothele bispora CBS 962.96]
KKKRVAWARGVKGFNCSKVIWSDECYVYCDDSHSQVFVTCHPDEVFEDDCLVPAFKQSNTCVMVWACVMKGMKGPLVVLEYSGGKGGGMNADHYQEQVLSGALAEFYKGMESERGGIKFQRDGAPSHKAKGTQKWL